MHMTAEEKLKKCIDFIKQLESYDVHDKYDNFNLKDLEEEARGDCYECDCDVKVKLSWPSHISLNTEYVDIQAFEDLKDRAWHVLADIAE